VGFALSLLDILSYFFISSSCDTVVVIIINNLMFEAVILFNFACLLFLLSLVRCSSPCYEASISASVSSALSSSIVQVS